MALEAVLIGLATAATIDGAIAAAAVLVGAAAIVLVRGIEECAVATGVFLTSRDVLSRGDALDARRDVGSTGLETAA
jgi:hypothetical protein